MSTKYLLPCGCGASTPVETAQAGESVACTCGAMLDVPTLRGIRNLPLAAGSGEQESTWNPAKGMLLLGTVVLTIGLGVFGYLALTSPYLDPARVRLEADYLSPAESWQKWIYFQQGLPGQYSPQAREILDARPFRNQLSFGGGVAFAAGIVMLAGGCYKLKQTPVGIKS